VRVDSVDAYDQLVSRFITAIQKRDLRTVVSLMSAYQGEVQTSSRARLRLVEVSQGGDTAVHGGYAGVPAIRSGACRGRRLLLDQAFSVSREQLAGWMMT